MTPSVFEEPRLKEKWGHPIPGMFRKSVKNWGGRPACDWTENLKTGEIVGSQPIGSNLRNLDKN